MTKKYLIAFPLLLVFAAMLAFNGCKRDNPNEPSTTDEQFFNIVVTGGDASTLDIFESDKEALDESVQLQALKVKIGKEMAIASITPIRWGRVIDNVSRSITKPIVTQADTIAVVETKVTFTGRFIIQALSGTDTVVIKKPFTESINRNVKFERVARTRYPRLNWKLDAVSVAVGGTENPAIQILALDLVTPNQTFTVTDPANYFMQIDRWWIRHLPIINNKTVTLRVTVSSATSDSDMVTLHFAPGTFGLHHKPLALKSTTQSGGNFIRIYEVTHDVSGSLKKFAHLMVSATTRSSQYSDVTTDFSSVVWGIPFKTSE